MFLIPNNITRKEKKRNALFLEWKGEGNRWKAKVLWGRLFEVDNRELNDLCSLCFSFM